MEFPNFFTRSPMKTDNGDNRLLHNGGESSASGSGRNSGSGTNNNYMDNNNYMNPYYLGAAPVNNAPPAVEKLPFNFSQSFTTPVPPVAAPAPFFTAPAPFFTAPAPFFTAPAPLVAAPVPFTLAPDPLFTAPTPFFTPLASLAAPVHFLPEPEPPAESTLPVFSTYNTYQRTNIQPEKWKVATSRKVHKRPSGPFNPPKKSGRGIPPSVEMKDWNVWTVGNLKFKHTEGGLHLDYFRMVLERIDGCHHRKANRAYLEGAILDERARQFKDGLVVDKPGDWSEGAGWWVFVQPA